MRKVFGLLVAWMFMGQLAWAQQDPVIFEINNRPIYKSEFMKDFLASIGKSENDAPTPCTYEKRQALEDYVNLFLNYKVKLEDAFRLGYDQDSEMQKELKTYREELAAPYLIDSVTMDSIMREAYERSRYSLHAAHILIKMKSNPTPADTLKAYRKALEVYEELKNGADFYEVSNKVVSDAQVAGLQRQINPKEGDLGYFTVFDMVYPFESAAYNLQPGEISKPVRTRFGYHIIKLFTRVEMYGQLELRHIWINDGHGNDPKAESKIQNAYERLKGGEAFESIAANYSDDRQSAHKGGLMPKLASNQILPEYINEADKLAVDQYSEPFHTDFGWHIIKVVSREKRPTYEEMLPYFKQKMARDPRAQISQDRFLKNIQQKYGFTDYVAQGKASYQELVNMVDKSIFEKGWEFRDTMLTKDQVLLNFAGTDHTLNEFCHFVEDKQSVEMPGSLEGLIDKRYKEFVKDLTLQYADSRLETEYPEFADLMAEYRNGLMIFSYNETEIWKKAVYDTVGFLDFYDQQSQKKVLDNPEDASYFWDYRARVTVVEVNDSTLLPLDKSLKVALTAMKKQWSSSILKENLMKKCDKSHPATVSVNLKMIEKGNMDYISDNQWKKGVYARPEGMGYKIMIVEQISDPCLKTLEEARGYYLSEYQDEMERRVTAALREKFNVKIHQEVIDEITY